MQFRKHFGYDVEAASNEAAVSFVGEESMTVQSMAEDADINVLMERFGLTGQMPVNPRVPMYGDFTGITDYQSAVNSVMNAFDGFMELPAKIRARFNNNPQELLEFVMDDANIDEARKLGLLKEKVDGQSAAGGGAGGASRGAGKASAGDRGKDKRPAGGGKAPSGGGEGSGADSAEG
jgi:phage internal scaffolding protein